MLGMRRRVYTYLAQDGLGALNLLTTLGSILLAIGILVSLFAFVTSLRSGARAPADPWRADTLEWATPSPPPAYGFLRIPTVATLHPLWDEHDEFADPRAERTFAQGRQTLATTAIGAVPRAVAGGEEDTVLPLIIALVITAVFAFVIVRRVELAAACAAATFGLAVAWLWPSPVRRAVESAGEPHA
jgi:hypothetical protein